MKGILNQPFRKGRLKITTITEKNPSREDPARDFADCLMMLGNPQEAAIRIGIKPESALKEGLRLKSSADVKRRLRSRKRGGAEIEALAGLRRLAFGRINDALALLKDDFSESDFEHLDLFNVSEIKRVKGGGVEIKFFDRLEALEKLAEIEDKASDTAVADNFFTALQKSLAQSEGADRAEI